MVKIYTTPVCVYCKMAKELFKKNNIAFEEIDVTTDDRLVDEMVAKSHQMAVPVIDIDGEIFIGFNRGELEKALKITV
ncbi:MAG TPA: glutaredoxin family protein [Candidatus Paceibacterota bacterium]|nr:glutaredoxin family protein [Candidatus Paceibacterota bacterium]